MTLTLINECLDFKNKKIIFRNLNAADTTNYQIFSNQIAKETTFTLHYLNQPICMDNLKLKWDDKSDLFLELGGFDNEQIIAHLSLFKPRPHHPFELHIGEFGLRILKDYWNIGIGSYMLKLMEKFAKSTNFKRLQGRVRTSNSRGLKFYQKNGYEIEGIKKKAVWIDNQWENEFYIAKIFE
ncbi:putative acetyltransferase YhhY [Candidatus Rubidus massiliensis]|nr:putative acetyltransferase YhhY [Candidatus Rubidus massiliensis]